MLQPEKLSTSRAIAALAMLTLASTLLFGCSSFRPREVVPISDIIAASQSRQSSSQIINSMSTSRTAYALRGSDFAILAERGVPDPVLDQLQLSFFQDVESLTRRWYERRMSGGPTHLYPQPLDLENLDRGGNGMAPTTNVGRFTSGTRPPGVPEWVPAYPAAFSRSISADDVLEMSKSGTPTQEIIDTIHNSLIRPVYASTGFQFSRLRVGAISGSTLANFSKQGVASEVLDALQAVYFANHVEFSRIRYRSAI